MEIIAKYTDAEMTLALLLQEANNLHLSPGPAHILPFAKRLKAHRFPEARLPGDHMVHGRPAEEDSPGRKNSSAIVVLVVISGGKLLDTPKPLSYQSVVSDGHLR